MQTNLADPIRRTPEGQTADEIIRRCVHCGICNAVCPTYRLSGNEADGPRGCIYQIKQLLQNDPKYAERAADISALSKDIVEILSSESHRLHAMMHKRPSEKIAYHPPCTQQYGQKLSGSVENLFARLDILLYLPANSGQCCGAAGTYALLQPQTAGCLKTEKLTALNELQPDIILSANIGCIAHLGGGKIPVRHWIEYLDELLA